MFKWLRRLFSDQSSSRFGIKLHMHPWTDWVYDYKSTRVKVCVEANDENRSVYCLFDDVVDIPYRPNPLSFEIDVPVDCKDISIYEYNHHPDVDATSKRINGFTNVKAGRYVLHYEFPKPEHR